MVKVTVDKNKCIGCGACEAICPITFELENGKSIVKSQPKKISCEQDACDSCPVNAIKIEK